jgi:hypothetical protein
MRQRSPASRISEKVTRKAVRKALALQAARYEEDKESVLAEKERAWKMNQEELIAAEIARRMEDPKIRDYIKKYMKKLRRRVEKVDVDAATIAAGVIGGGGIIGGTLLGLLGCDMSDRISTRK